MRFFIALIFCLLSFVARAQTTITTIDQLGLSLPPTGAEFIPLFQTSNPALRASSQCIADANAYNPICWYNASGLNATTTGTISASSKSLSVASATGWSVGMGIAVANAGTGGNTELISSVTACSANSTGVCGSTTFTLNDAAVATATTQTVNHDDTAALSAAITAALSASKPIHLQGTTGCYPITSGLTPINASLMFYGDGRTQSTICNRSTTANVLTIDYQNSLSPVTTTISGTFRDFGIIQASGITPTAGAGFLIGSSAACGPCTQYTSALSIQNVTINGQWAGIKTRNGLIRDWILDVDINNSVGTCGSTSAASGGGIVYDNPSPGGDNAWTNVQIAMTTAGDGVCIYNADTQTFTNLKVNSGSGATGGGVRFKGGTILRQTFVNPSIEGNGTAPSCAFDFNAGTITQVTITGYEIALIPTPFCSPANVTGSLAIIPGLATDNGANPISSPWIVRPLPTSSSGLPSGSVWNNSGVLNYVP